MKVGFFNDLLDILKEIRESLKQLIQKILPSEQRALSCDTDSITVCGEGIDGINRTLRTDVNNILATLPSASVQSQIGRLFSVFNTITLTEATNNAVIVIENPADSGRIMYVDSVFGGSEVVNPVLVAKDRLPVNIAIARESTTGTINTSITNLNYGSTVVSTMVATVNLTPGGGARVAHISEVLGSYDFNLKGRIIVPPGHTFGVQLIATESVQASPIRFLNTITWYEVDIPT